MKIEIKILNKEFYRVDKLHESYYDTPRYATPESAAMDLVCTKDIYVYSGECVMIPTGIAIWIGSQYYKLKKEGAIFGSASETVGLILPRSGLGMQGLILANTIGVIDEDYQGELMVSAWNRNSTHITSRLSSYIELKAGDRFAQLMFVPIIKAEWQQVEEFSNITERGEGGFGSTDKKGKL